MVIFKHKFLIIKLQAGLGLIEIMVSITIIGLVMGASARMFINSMANQNSNRRLTRVESEVQNIFNTYRTMNYLNVLGLFGTSYTEISNGANVQIYPAASDRNTKFTLNLTAIKTKNESIPEAIRLTIVGFQNRNYFNRANFQYETILSQVR